MDIRQETKSLSSLMRFLDKLDYPDAYRVAREVKELTDLDRSKLTIVKNRLLNHEPWEYIKGNCEFCGRNFWVNKNVLIPRIETEELVNFSTKAVKEFRLENPTFPLQIIDIGTGSGCIAISIAKKLEELDLLNNISIYATDISKKALDIAQRNSMDLEAKQISFQQSNILSNVILDKNIDTIIVSNPPYIPENNLKKLDKSVQNFEPKLALHGGKNGTKFYRKIISQLIQKRIKVIDILFEIEDGIEDLLEDFIRKTLIEAGVKISKDVFGRARYLEIRKIRRR